MSRLIGLYPRPWRDRYEAEFRALTDERPPSLIEEFDILRGAIDARLHPQVHGKDDPEPVEPLGPDDLRFARALGIGAMLGAVLWVAAFVVLSNGPIRYDGGGAYRDGGEAAPLLLLAVMLFSGGLLGQLILLPRRARLARWAAGIAIPSLLLWGLAPWLVAFGAVSIVALLTMAIAGWRSGSWSTRPSLAAVIGCLASVGIVAYGVLAMEGDRLAGAGLFALVGAVLVPVWLAVGATLVRRPT